MATGSRQIDIYLNVCDSVSGAVSLATGSFKAGHRGKVAGVRVSIDAKDVAEFDFAPMKWKPRMGGASKMKALSVRVCKTSKTAIAVYDEPMMNAMGCCDCCTCPDGTTCCAYGDSDCYCGC